MQFCARLHNTVWESCFCLLQFSLAHFELTHSHHSSSMSTSLYRKFCKIIKKYSSTNVGWLNIHRPKYETHAYKENLLYVNTLTKKNR